MNAKEFLRQDEELRHAIQTGEKFEMETGPNANFYAAHPGLANDIKHLRTGISCAMCEHGAISRLLVSKGLVTEAEFYDASLNSLKEEITRYEQRISSLVGRPVRLR